MSEWGKCKNCNRDFQKCSNKNSWRCSYCSPECYSKVLIQFFEKKEEQDKLKTEQNGENNEKNKTMEK